MSATAESLTTNERELLAAARGGDEGAFEALIQPRRSELHAHCYRMLGSVHDAEDALQEALLRAWRGLPRFEARSSLRSWLYTIATNTSLNAIEKRPKHRVLPIDYGPEGDPHGKFHEPLADSVWLEPYADRQLGLEDGRAAPEARYEQRESVELAFVATLQHLPANQRAVLILREVLGFSAKEVADQLETTPQSVNSALQRARKTIDEKLPEQSQQETLAALDDERLRELVESYSRALEQGDLEALFELVTDDITWSMPPTPNWYRGHEQVAAFLEFGPFTVDWRHVPTYANGQLAVGCYAWEEGNNHYGAFVLDVLTLRPDGRVAEVNAWIDRSVFDRFGLPQSLPADTPKR